VIVGLRVEVLKLGSSVGRQLQQATTLESGNAALRAQVSALSGNQRIEQLASTMGMTMPGPMDTHFVNASSGAKVNAAIRGIHVPSAQTFLSGIASERQTDAKNTLGAANISAVGALGGTVPTSTAGTSTAGTSTAGTSTLGTSSAGTPTSGTPTSVTSASNVAATNTSTAGTTPNTSTAGTTPSTGTGSTSTGTGSVGAVSNTSGTNTPTGPNTGGASLGG
jgi:hypothetical protein